MLVNVLNICSDDELMGATDQSPEATVPHPTVVITPEQIAELKRKEEKRITLQKKILAVAKMAKYFHTLREESETGELIEQCAENLNALFSASTKGPDAKWHAPNWHLGRLE